MVFELPSFDRSRPSVPDVVMVPPVKPLFVAMDVTVPFEFLTQVPFTAKHPFVRLIPLANVEDAVDDVTFSRLVCIPHAKVDVAVVDVAVMYATVGEVDDVMDVPSEFNQPCPNDV